MSIMPSHHRNYLPTTACWIVIFCAAGPAASGVCCAEESAFETVVDQTFRADVDQSEQKYVMMTPRGFKPDQPVSVLIALHGHGSDRWQFVQQKRGECRATRDVAAAKKMILVTPDYRATTSWMGAEAEADVLQIIQILKKKYKVERVILCGGSMGGTGALTFTALRRDLIDGVVSLNGTANLVEYTRFQNAIAESFGGSKSQVPAEYRKRSAEFFPKQFSMPFAASTGGRDKTVPADSVLRLISDVRKNNDHVLNIHRPDGGHETSYKDTRRALEFVIAASEKNKTGAALQRRS